MLAKELLGVSASILTISAEVKPVEGCYGYTRCFAAIVTSILLYKLRLGCRHYA